MIAYSILRRPSDAASLVDGAGEPASQLTDARHAGLVRHDAGCPTVTEPRAAAGQSHEAARSDRSAPGHGDSRKRQAPPREILGLRTALDQSCGRIAAALGLDVRAVKSRIARARDGVRPVTGGIAPGTLRIGAANSGEAPVAPANGHGPVEAGARRTVSTFGTSLRAGVNVAGAPRGANPTERLTRAGPPTDPRLPSVAARSQAPRSPGAFHAAAIPPQCSVNPKPVKPSAFAAPPGDWLVVIGRLEASVFRSTLSGAAPECIRAHLPEGGAGVRPAANDQQDGPEHRSLAFFEPLASALYGARRILVFGRVTPLGDETGPFLFWLCNHHPELAERVVDSVPIDPHEISESALLAKARTCYKRTVVAAPPASGSGSADRAEISRPRA